LPARATAAVRHNMRAQKKRRHWHALLNGERYDAAPSGLRVYDSITEAVLEQKVGHSLAFIVDLADTFEKAGTDNAAAAPKARDLAKLQVPFELFGRGRHLLVSLSIGDDLRGIERVSDGVYVGFGRLAHGDRGVRK
jgi:hypothetical protein